MTRLAGQGDVVSTVELRATASPLGDRQDLVHTPRLAAGDPGAHLEPGDVVQGGAQRSSQVLHVLTELGQERKIPVTTMLEHKN